MIKTFPEKLKSKVNTWGKKNPRYKSLYRIYEKVMLFFYHIGVYFSENRKRYMCLCFFLLFFLTNVSFKSYRDPTQLDRIQASSDIQLTFEENIRPEEDVGDVYFQEDQSIIGENQFTLDDISEEHEEYYNETLQVEKNTSATYINGRQFSKDDWRLILVNKQHPIPEDYEFELETIKDGMQCDKRILKDLLTMLKDAQKEKINLAIRSPYRSTSRQVFVFRRKLNTYLQKGFSYMDAYRKASQTVMIPGASEHEIGLALDITGDSYFVLDEAFEKTEEGKWLADNSYKYGFILRYPREKKHITSIDYEPWHFRYVGVDAATVMFEQKLTLEEFWEHYLY